MTRATLFEQSDRPTATQAHGTHLRSGQEIALRVPPHIEGRSQDFHTLFERFNDEITERDRRSQPERILLALSRFLIAFLGALIGILIVANWPT